MPKTNKKHSVVEKINFLSPNAFKLQKGAEHEKNAEKQQIMDEESSIKKTHSPTQPVLYKIFTF